MPHSTPACFSYIALQVTMWRCDAEGRSAGLGGIEDAGCAQDAIHRWPLASFIAQLT